jgi:hypothetical protein
MNKVVLIELVVDCPVHNKKFLHQAPGERIHEIPTHFFSLYKMINPTRGDSWMLLIQITLGKLLTILRLQ